MSHLCSCASSCCFICKASVDDFHNFFCFFGYIMNSTLYRVIIVVCCRQELPDTFHEAFKGQWDELADKISVDTGLLEKLQEDSLITDGQKRHLEVTAGVIILTCLK